MIECGCWFLLVYLMPFGTHGWSCFFFVCFRTILPIKSLAAPLWSTPPHSIILASFNEFCTRVFARGARCRPPQAKGASPASWKGHHQSTTSKRHRRRVPSCFLLLQTSSYKFPKSAKQATVLENHRLEVKEVFTQARARTTQKNPFA